MNTNGNSRPLVSMIVISYNQAPFVVETLESVKAQTYRNTELIIVDDCSTDGSVEIINRWLCDNNIAATFIRHGKNQGVCKALNDGVRAARGKYISATASDDIWLPDKIERQVDIMESQPDGVGVVYSDAIRIDESGKTLPGLLIASSAWNMPEMPQGQLLDLLVMGNIIPGMTTLIRRCCYDVVGLYDECLPWEDWDMWMRIARHYAFVSSAVPFAKYRVHNASYSHSDPVRILKESCQVCQKQFQMGGLSPSQKSKLADTLARYYFDLAANERQVGGSRRDTIKYQAACIRYAGLRPPGRFVDWASVLGYGIIGIKHFRWWKH